MRFLLKLPSLKYVQTQGLSVEHVLLDEGEPCVGKTESVHGVKGVLHVVHGVQDVQGVLQGELQGVQVYYKVYTVYYKVYKVY